MNYLYKSALNNASLSRTGMQNKAGEWAGKDSSRFQTVLLHRPLPDRGFSENALSVFPDAILNVNTGLSTSEALTWRTVVPTAVESFTETE